MVTASHGAPAILPEQRMENRFNTVITSGPEPHRGIARVWYNDPHRTVYVQGQSGIHILGMGFPASSTSN